MNTTTFYKLHYAHDNTKECYVGSSSNFAQRKSAHKFNCNKPNSNAHNLRVYRYIRSNGGFANWTFTVLEERDNMTERRKLLRERVLTERHGGTLNTQKAGALLEVGKQEYDRSYHRQNADTDNICDRCGGMYRSKCNKTRHQRSQKCIRLTAERQAQPIIVNINININAEN